MIRGCCVVDVDPDGFARVFVCEVALLKFASAASILPVVWREPWSSDNRPGLAIAYNILFVASFACFSLFVCCKRHSGDSGVSGGASACSVRVARETRDGI